MLTFHKWMLFKKSTLYAQFLEDNSVVIEWNPTARGSPDHGALARGIVGPPDENAITLVPLEKVWVGTVKGQEAGFSCVVFVTNSDGSFFGQISYVATLHNGTTALRTIKV
jgi:hypothetical protein